MINSFLLPGLAESFLCSTPPRGRQAGQLSLPLWPLRDSLPPKYTHGSPLNFAAAGYATWQLYWNGALDQKALLPLPLPQWGWPLSAAVLDGREYFVLIGLLLVVAVLMVFKREADLVETRPSWFFPRRRIPGASNDIERE